MIRLLPDAQLLTDDDELVILTEALHTFQELDDEESELATTRLIRAIGNTRGPGQAEAPPPDDGRLRGFNAQARLHDVWNDLSPVTRSYLTVAQGIVDQFGNEIEYAAPGLAAQIGAAMEHEAFFATTNARRLYQNGDRLPWRRRPPYALFDDQWSLWDLIQLARDVLTSRHQEDGRLWPVHRALDQANTARKARNIILHEGATIAILRSLVHSSGFGPTSNGTTFWHVFAREIRELP